MAELIAIAEDSPKVHGSRSFLLFFGGERSPYSRVADVSEGYKELLVQGAICSFLNHLQTRYPWSVELTNHYWWLEGYGGRPESLPSHLLVDSRLLEVPYWNEPTGKAAATVLMSIRRTPAFPGAILPPFSDPDATSRLVLCTARPDSSSLSEGLARAAETTDIYKTFLEVGEVVLETIEHPWLGMHMKSALRVDELFPGPLRSLLVRLPTSQRT